MKQRTIKRFFSLSRTERKAFFEALGLLIGMRWRLRRYGMAALLPWASRQPDPVRPEDPAACRQVAAALVRARRVLLQRPTCLEQALAGGIMLQRRGQGFVIDIGMQRDTAGKVGGHAWLQAGETLICGGERTRQGFASIARYPAP